jgi:GTP-binding protein
VLEHFVSLFARNIYSDENSISVLRKQQLRQLRKMGGALHTRSILRGTLTPFLYPRLLTHNAPPVAFLVRRRDLSSTCARRNSDYDEAALASTTNPDHPHHEYVAAPFIDVRPISIASGAGGHGCISFHREKFVPNGPPNGGSGGWGGSIYIQAVYGETSLHKIGRQGVIKAGDGRSGQGSNISGRKGDDVVIRVPVGTVVREISRFDPNDMEDGEDEHGGNDKWTHYPQTVEANLKDDRFQDAKYPAHHHKAATQLLKHTHPTRIYLDLDKPTPQPILLVPGAPGGLGNPHFVTPTLRSPKFATKGNKGAKMRLQLELKVLADVGLVGLPNAGKSSFLRAVSGRKARVGEWAFTTLTPNIGTIVMQEKDLNAPLPAVGPDGVQMHPRFTIADIPGLVADAHLNKGLGLGFLRHIERARVMAFVIDLSRPDPVADLEALWKEVIAYENGEDNLEGEGMMAEMGSGSAEELEWDAELSEELAEQRRLELEEEELEKELEREIAEQEAKESGIEGLEDPGREFVEKSEGRPEEMEEFVQVEEAEDFEKFVQVEEAKVVKPKVKEEELVTFTGVAQFNKPEEDLTVAGELTIKREKMSTKPWFVIANKADLEGTEDKYWALKKHLEEKSAERPDGKEIGLIPISALREEGVDRAVDWMKGMLGF